MTNVFTWAQLCRVAEALGVKEDDDSKGGAMKLRKQLQQAIEQGKVKQIGRGRYHFPPEGKRT